jgi:CRISPR type IV-associated protein Csf1
MKCFYCGDECEYNNLIKDYIKPTFTNYEIVKCPDSKFICNECIWSFATNTETIILVDGEVREKSTPRNYSWVIEKDKKFAASKKHVKELREIILNPPEPPFKIIISDSGQKHLLFRAIWAQSINNYPIQFEEEQIIVNIFELENRLIIADKLSAAIGKVAILNPDKMSYAITINNYHGDLTSYDNWLNIYKEPLSRLAVWLAKNKQEAGYEYPAINNRTISAADSRIDRSAETDGRIRDEGTDGRDSQICFDFTGSIQR